MPTFETTASFDRAFASLSKEEQLRFRTTARDKFAADLEADGGFRAGLRVTKYRSLPNTWEMTWDYRNGGRALFQYGPEKKPGKIHVIWIAVGGHAEVLGS